MYHSDYDDSLRFLRLIHPQAACIEVRVKGAHGVYGRLFDDLERAAAYATEQSDRPETVAVWMTANAVDPSTWTADQKLTTDDNIPERTAFFIDFDAPRPKDANSADTELEATRVAAVQCIEFLAGLGFPAPVLMSSGNGHQVWHRTDLPADDGGLIERFLKVLAAKFPGVDTSVHNPGRVGRMPGTMNRKAPETPDRPQRLARIIDAPPHLEVVTRQMLESVAGVVSLPDLPTVQAEITPNIFDVAGFLTKHNRSFTTKRKNGGTTYDIKCPFRPEENDGGAWIWQDDEGTIRGGCHHNKCAKKGWKEIRNAIDPSFDKAAKESLPASITDAEHLARRHLEQHPDMILHRESVYEYRAGIWSEQRPEAVKRGIRRTMMRAFAEYGRQMKERGLDTAPPSVSEKLVGSVFGVLTSIVPEVQTAAPCWIDGGPAKDLVVCANGILNLTDLTLSAHTPRLFAVVKLPYAYDPKAECPTWQKYVGSVWPDDADAILLSQEFAGYTLLADNPLQVLMLLQGAKRGGKGVLVRTLCQMVGRENTCAISIRNFVKDFSLWNARGKSIIVIPDIRAPKKGLPPEVVEILKAITGGDDVDVNGKGRDIVSEPLHGKIIASTNDLLTFDDDSGAFFDRLVALKFTRSFLPADHPDYVDGQDQDPGLEDKLANELPGILNWAVAGLHRLQKRWRFTLPASSNALKNELAAEGSPIKRFAADHLVRDPGGRVGVTDLFVLWQDWCEAESLDCGTHRSFGMLLRSACPWVECMRASAVDANNERPREYRGIVLRNTVKQQTPA